MEQTNSKSHHTMHYKPKYYIKQGVDKSDLDAEAQIANDMQMIEYNMVAGKGYQRLFQSPVV